VSLLDPGNVNSLTSPPLRCFLFLSSEMDEKLIELMRKCEVLYDMSIKKYSDRVWKEKLWGQIGEELKKIR